MPIRVRKDLSMLPCLGAIVKASASLGCETFLVCGLCGKCNRLVIFSSTRMPLVCASISEVGPNACSAASAIAALAPVVN